MCCVLHFIHPLLVSLFLFYLNSQQPNPLCHEVSQQYGFCGHIYFAPRARGRNSGEIVDLSLVYNKRKLYRILRVEHGAAVTKIMHKDEMLLKFLMSFVANDNGIRAGQRVEQEKFIGGTQIAIKRDRRMKRSLFRASSQTSCSSY
ncbi:hypothetical protein CDAR_224781 [Caerostris darwini]|uniref:Uncharacterized protein n=1 Tax=Caerostris darwini TaxID=1538125 RepID=A0AAV4NCV2_9ARAC|nr:hypothetical protein CDAR_224781 [Caerostris darwini]